MVIYVYRQWQIVKKNDEKTFRQWQLYDMHVNINNDNVCFTILLVIP